MAGGLDQLALEALIKYFEHYLGLMEHRTLHSMKSDCFLVFSVLVPLDIRPRIGGGLKTRIVQFAFMQDGFYLDLPDTTLTLEEAKRVVGERAGFGFALNNPRKRLGELEHHLVQRQFKYGEQRIAAEDTAYVFFDLRQTPLDAWIKVDASAFEVERRWEAAGFRWVEPTPNRLPVIGSGKDNAGANRCRPGCVLPL